MSRSSVTRGGYIIQTTLNPEVQRNSVRSAQANVSPDADGVAAVMSVIRPGTRSHDVLSMASSRNYGLNANASQTVQPQPFSLVGDGAGSVFKIFTVAAGMEKGMGTNTSVSVPSRVQLEGFGAGGAAGTPGLRMEVTTPRIPAQRSTSASAPPSGG